MKGGCERDRGEKEIGEGERDVRERWEREMGERAGRKSVSERERYTNPDHWLLSRFA